MLWKCLCDSRIDLPSSSSAAQISAELIQKQELGVEYRCPQMRAETPKSDCAASFGAFTALTLVEKSTLVVMRPSGVEEQR